MARVLFLLALSLLSTTVHAARFIVQDPCSEKVWLDVPIKGKLGDSVGAVTVATLKAHDVPFVGQERGINIIGDTPVGDDALEILSDSEMRAYGWCYSHNGVKPEVFPDQVFIESEDDTIRWYFGFAHYLAGNWTTYCSPTHVERPQFICD